MIDYQTIRLVHSHGDERFPMTKREPHDAAELDPERNWGRGATIYRCTRCDEEVVVLLPGNEVPERELA